MDYRKILIVSPCVIIEKIGSILDYFVSKISNKYPKLEIESFRASLSYRDCSFSFNNLKEFEKQKEFLFNKKYLYYLDIKIGFKAEKNAYREIFSSSFRINSFNNKFLDVELSSSAADLINIFDNLFEGLLNFFPRSKYYLHNNKNELNKIREIGINKCISVLENFDKCLLKLNNPINNEKELQALVFPVLVSHFSDLEDEFHLLRFGNIEYKPDFGIPSASLLVETKYLRKKADLKKIQKEISEDTVGYLKAATHYKSIVIFIYNSINLPVLPKFVKDLKKLNGIKSIIFVPGVRPIGR